MDEFEVGDRVRVRKGMGWDQYPDGREGTIKNVFCDYGDHGVEVLFDDGTSREFINQDMFELVDGNGRFEYAVTWLHELSGKHYPIAEYQWTTLDGALAEAVEAEEDGWTGVKLVKRRKAGEVQDV